MKRANFKCLVVLTMATILLLGMFSCGSVTRKFEKEDTETEAKKKFIGLELWSVKDDMSKDARGTIAEVGSVGHKFVETAGYDDGKVYGMDPVEFKDLCEKNGLKFLGAHTGQDVPTNENWDKTMEWWDVCNAAHKSAGVKWIVQPWMGETGYKSLEGLKTFRNSNRLRQTFL